MVETKELNQFNKKELERIRSMVISSYSKAELLAIIDKALYEKNPCPKTSLNSRFQIDRMNIDPDYIILLHKNGIGNLKELLEIKNLWSLEGMTISAHEQISWAREFFDMRPKPITEKTSENNQQVKTKGKKAENARHISNAHN